MLIPLAKRTDVYLIMPDLTNKVPLCGDTPENIIIGVLKGELHALFGYNESSGTIEGFCIYRRIDDSTAFIFALYAPGLGWMRRNEYIAWLNEQGFSTLRWCSQRDEAIWSTLAPGARKLWTVWEWDRKILH